LSAAQQRDAMRTKTTMAWARRMGVDDPHSTSAIVEELFRAVPDKYLIGLDCVVLTNTAGLSRRDRVGRVWSRKRKFDKSGVLGRYQGHSGDSSAYIELGVDRIVLSLRVFRFAYQCCGTSGSATSFSTR